MVDTLAYMSCERMTSYNQRAYFTFKMGAYGPDSGVSLNRRYFDNIRGRDLERKVSSIKKMENNLGVRLQMGIHLQNRYKTTIKVDSSTAGEQALYTTAIMGSLSNDTYVSQVVELDKDLRINYFRGLKGLDWKIVEGYLYMTTLTPQDQDKLRNGLEGGDSHPLVLTLGYTKKDFSAGGLIGPDQSPADEKAFGRGYQLRFENGHVYDFFSSDKRLISSERVTGPQANINRTLSGVIEVDLNGGEPVSDARWKCPEGARFMIFRPKDVKRYWNDLRPMPCNADFDRDSGYFVDRPIDLAGGPEVEELNPEEVEAVYNILRPEDWSVDFERRCVVPKKNSAECYGSIHVEGNPDVKYFDYGPETDDRRCGENVVKERPIALCPHYVSICFRQ